MASEAAAISKQEELSRQQREQARLVALREDQEEQHERERQRMDLIRDLASSDASAEKILARNKAAALKRSSARRVKDEETRINPSLLNLGIGPVEDVDVEDEGPFDPLDGEGEESSLYVVQKDYDDAYIRPTSALIQDGLIKSRKILLHWLGDSMCMMCINGDYSKLMLGCVVYYRKS